MRKHNAMKLDASLTYDTKHDLEFANNLESSRLTGHTSTKSGDARGTPGFTQALQCSGEGAECSPRCHLK